LISFASKQASQHSRETWLTALTDMAKANISVQSLSFGAF
jgi:hypothetical protein